MIIIYDSNMISQATLQNATSIGYEKRLNEVWTAQFTLPADDPKNTECLPFRFVEIFDGDERVDLFRILPSKLTKDDGGLTKTYQCEHVLSTLLDDILFQYHQTTNLSPTNTLDFILDHQTTTRWQVGTVDFTNLYSYKWENENLLSALFSVPKAYNEEYIFTWDTTTTPWTLNLVSPPEEVTAEIRYSKNLVGITKDEDPTYIVTRLYPLGYGEGDNQLTIKSVNSGVPYIDSDTIGTYGIIATTFVDKAEENPATLKAKAQAELEKIKISRVAYSASAADIYQITNDSIDKFREPGVKIKVYDSESGLEFTSRVTVFTKSDVDSAPGDCNAEISNKILDLADSNSSLANRQRISDVYAQGATNIDSNDYEDNCDNTHPAVIKFYIPNECVRVNKCLLSYSVSKFRAYERATAVYNFGNISTETTDVNSWILIPPQSLSGDFMNMAGDPPHVHSMYSVSHTHNVILPDHHHNLGYGIFEFEEQTDGVTIKVDGNTMPEDGMSGTDIDIMDYLDTDTNGKITRGTFHTVEIYPDTTLDNPDGLARVTATVVKQIFIQSRGGVDA